MSSCYNLDGIKTELKKELETKITLLEAWENVTFPTKKDGTPFSSMNKNFNSAKYHAEDYAMQPGTNKLTVYTSTKLSGYINDTIDCYNLICDMKNENQLAKTQNYMPKQSYLKQVYCFDMEDIKEAITNRIAQLEKDIDRLNNEIENAENVFNTFRSAFGNALEQLAKDTEKTGENYSDLFYLVKDTVIERYPYC